MWIGGADNDADRGQAVGRHSSTRLGHHPPWRHVNRSGVGRVEVESVLNSWRNLRGDACRRPLVDPCYLRGMPVTVLVDREAKKEVGSLLITGENSSGSIAAFEVVVPSAQRQAAPVHSHDHYEETIHGINQGRRLKR
jgi:hypothetical protein